MFSSKLSDEEETSRSESSPHGICHIGTVDLDVLFGAAEVRAKIVEMKQTILINMFEFIIANIWRLIFEVQ